MAATEAVDVPFLRGKRKESRVQAQKASMAAADTKLEALRARVKALEGVKTVVTIKTRGKSSS